MKTLADSLIHQFPHLPYTYNKNTEMVFHTRYVYKINRFLCTPTPNCVKEDKIFSHIPYLMSFRSYEIWNLLWLTKIYLKFLRSSDYLLGVKCIYTDSSICLRTDQLSTFIYA